MVAKRKKKDGPGTLIRGADGRLYYLTDSNLKKYATRISPKDQRKVTRAPRKRLGKLLKDIGIANSDSVSRARVGPR